MERKTRGDLEATVADLERIREAVQSYIPTADTLLRNDLLEIQSQSEAAIRFYSRLLPRPHSRNLPIVVQTVAQAAFGASGVGLVLPAPKPRV